MKLLKTLKSHYREGVTVIEAGFISHPPGWPLAKPPGFAPRKDGKNRELAHNESSLRRKTLTSRRMMQK